MSIHEHSEVHSTLYTYLPIRYWQIRILVIEPAQDVDDEIKSTLRLGDVLDGQEVRLEGYPLPSPFLAISYCWGDDERRKEDEKSKEGEKRKEYIICNRQMLPLGRRAVQALKRVRKYHQQRLPFSDCHVWIDTVCINQNDAAEKAVEVPRMASIYGKAKEVLVYLGEGDTKIRALLSRMEDKPTASQEKVLKETLAETGNTTAIRHSQYRNGLHQRYDVGSALHRLLNLKWFGRVWTKQELWAAKNIVLLYDNAYCSWNALNVDVFERIWAENAGDQRDLHLARKTKRLRRVLKQHRRADNSAIARTKRDDRPNPYLEDTETYELDIVNVLRRCTDAVCTNSKDYIYGLMGMSSTNPYIHGEDAGQKQMLSINYLQSHQPADTFEDLARYIIGRDDSLSLLFLDGAFNKPSRETSPLGGPDLPSWVPDWHNPYGDLCWLRRLMANPISTKYRTSFLAKTMSLDDDLYPFKLPPTRFPLQLTGVMFGVCYTTDFNAKRERSMCLGSISMLVVELADRYPLVASAQRQAVVGGVMGKGVRCIVPDKASEGDIAVAVHGAYSLLLLRPLDLTADHLGPTHRYIGPVVIPDDWLQPVLCRPAVLGKDLTEHLSSILEPEEGNFDTFLVE